MFGLSFGEILIIAILLLLVVGPDRLPETMRFAGRIYGQIRRAADEFRRSFVLEADRVEAEARYKEVEAKRAEARRKAEEAKAKGGSAESARSATGAVARADRALPVEIEGGRPKAPDTGSAGTAGIPQAGAPGVDPADGGSEGEA